MNTIEQKVVAIKVVQGILENRMMEQNRMIVAEHIMEALQAYGWRGPKELRWLQERAWDQAKASGDKNPYKEEE